MYKRQVATSKSGCTLSQRFNPTCNASLNSGFGYGQVGKLPSGSDCSGTVSYTHLDVYKRQALAQYADHLFIMTYDEHYEGGAAGPVAGIQFVEDSIQYALSKTTADKMCIRDRIYYN